MKEIPLINSDKFALVDDEDYELVAAHNWRRSDWGYAVATAPHPTKSKATVTLSMHRVILGLDLGDKRQGDHRDLDGLNNCRSNLRICTPGENARNKGIYSNNRSGFKGVGWFASQKRWRARIRVNGKSIGLGYFSTPEDAYAAYCQAALKYHGEFANLGKGPA